MEIHLVLNTGMITTGGKFEAWQINEEESKVNLVKVLFNKATACEVFSNICHLFILPETTWMVWTVVHNYELRNTWLYFLRNKLCIFICTTSISDVCYMDIISNVTLTLLWFWTLMWYSCYPLLINREIIEKL